MEQSYYTHIGFHIINSIDGFQYTKETIYALTGILLLVLNIVYICTHIIYWVQLKVDTTNLSIWNITMNTPTQSGQFYETRRHIPVQKGVEWEERQTLNVNNSRSTWMHGGDGVIESVERLTDVVFEAYYIHIHTYLYTYVGGWAGIVDLGCCKNRYVSRYSPTGRRQAYTPFNTGSPLLLISLK